MQHVWWEDSAHTAEGQRALRKGASCVGWTRAEHGPERQPWRTKCDMILSASHVQCVSLQWIPPKYNKSKRVSRAQGARGKQPARYAGATTRRANGPAAVGSRAVRSKFSMVQRGDKVVVSGTDYVASVALASGTTKNVGDEVWSSYVSMEAMTGTRLYDISKMYERYHIDKLTYFFNGGEPTSERDQFIAAYDADPSDAVPVGDAALHAAAASTNSGVFKGWENATLSVPSHRLDKWLYCNKGVSLPAGTSNDQRAYTAGYVNVTAATPITTATTARNFMTVWCEYTVTFDIPQLQSDAPTAGFYQLSVPQPLAGDNIAIPAGTDLINGLAAGRVLMSSLEKRTELESATLVADASKKIRLPAGTYMYEILANAMEQTTYAPAAAISSGSANVAVDLFTPAGAKLDGSGDSPFGIVNPPAAMSLPVSGSKYAQTSAVGYLDLKSDALLTWVSGAVNLILTGQKVLAVMVKVNKIFSSFNKNASIFTNGVLGADAPAPEARSNQVVADYMREATNGTLFAGFDTRTALPDGWHWVEQQVRPAAQQLFSWTCNAAGVVPAAADSVEEDDESEFDRLSQQSAQRRSAVPPMASRAR